MSPNGHGEPIEVTERPLFLLVTRLPLMSHCENQHDIVGRHPAIFRHVAELTARQYQFPAPVFSLAAQQRMIRKDLEGSPNAEHPLAREFWVVVCKKIEEPLEIGERSSGYLDVRHARARGRRTPFPAARASR